MASKKGAKSNADTRSAAETSAVPSNETMRTVAWVQLLGEIAERFGVPFALLILCLGAIWAMGDAKTKNDFIREMLFGDITGNPATRVFFLGLILLSLIGSVGVFRRLMRERTELKRVAGEKSKLQEERIGSELSHTQERGSA